jgi:alpha-L-rhamnosidase
VAILLPWDLYEAFGDVQILALQWEGMVAWLEKGVKRDCSGLWDKNSLQLSDWLDPTAPPDSPGDGKTDPTMVADAYLVHCTRIISAIASVLGKTDVATKYRQQYQDLRAMFSDEYISPSGRTVSDSQTAFALVLKFDLLSSPQRERAIERLKYIVAKDAFKIATGFAGTPIILHALADGDALSHAYRMLQEKGCPSWLYPVSIGATSMWERWDSMREDGTINPGEMTR